LEIYSPSDDIVLQNTLLPTLSHHSRRLSWKKELCFFNSYSVWRTTSEEITGNCQVQHKVLS